MSLSVKQKEALTRLCAECRGNKPRYYTQIPANWKVMYSLKIRGLIAWSWADAGFWEDGKRGHESVCRVRVLTAGRKALEEE